MSDIDLQNRLAAQLHDRRACGYTFCRPAGGRRTQILAAKNGSGGKYVMIDEAIDDIAEKMGVPGERIYQALLSMKLSVRKVETQKTLSQKLEGLIRSAQQAK